jgi:hypothetical protein
MLLLFLLFWKWPLQQKRIAKDYTNKDLRALNKAVSDTRDYKGGFLLYKGSFM